MRLINRQRTYAHNDLVGAVCTTSPNLSAVEYPAAVGAVGPGRSCGKVGAGLRLAHPDRREQASFRDPRQNPLSLFVSAVGHHRGRDLAVGHPVRSHRSAVREQFLGHDVALEVAASLSAVDGRDGQTQEAGVAESGAEGLVPSRQPGVDRRLPPELSAVVAQEVANRRP